MSLSMETTIFEISILLGSMIIRNCQLIIILLFIYLSAFSQYTASDFEQITRREGLGHNQVECIFQDSYGFIWFGTRNGLCRFNGYDFTTFRRSKDSTSISGNRILSIAEDGEGNLWVGTFQNGINKYIREQGTFNRYTDIPGLGSRINKIRVFNDKSVWFCTNYGLGKYDPESDEFRVFLPDMDRPGTINSSRVFDLIKTSKGTIYVATWNAAIQRFDPETEKFTDISYERSPELNVDYRKRIIEDHEGNIWISANKHGLCRLDPETGESKLFTSKNSGLQTDILNGDMLVDEKGMLWIATDGSGINILDIKKNEFIYLNGNTTEGGSLPGNQVYSIFQDMQNHIWIGFYDKGIVHYDPQGAKFNQALTSSRIFQEFKAYSVLCLFQDSRGNNWIGTDGDGLFRIDSRFEIKRFIHDESDPNSISSNVITSVGEDEQGNILVGTYAEGFNIYDRDKDMWKRIYQGGDNFSVNSSSVWEIFTDSRENVWLGLLGSGLDLYNSKTGEFKNMGLDSDGGNRVNNPNIMVIIEDNDGDIWFGSEGNGVNILDRQTGTMMEPDFSSENQILGSAMIRSLYQDRRGKIWIGTEGDGLYIYDKTDRSLEHLTMEDGLTDMIVQGIQEDNLGNFWITTGNGLCLYNPNTGNWQSFFVSDGLSANEYNSDAILRLNNGKILAGSTNGLDIIDPENIVFNQNIPRVVFTSLEVMNKNVVPGQKINDRVILKKEINYTSKIKLKHSDKIFTIEFAALNYSHPEKCLFQYKLEGFDEEWITTNSSRRLATYSNLDPDTYIFKVKASNNDKKWGFNTREIILEVAPPFWGTWWFILILVSILITIFFIINRVRINIYKNNFMQQKALQEKRIVELEKENLEMELKKLTFFRFNRKRNLLELKNRLEGISMKARETVKAKLEDIISEIDSEISSDEDWKLIEPQLDTTYNNFLTKLQSKHPDLTLTELKVAAYIRMNLSTKEMAEYMRKTIRAIENDRHRLRKKLSLPPGDSLSNYLSSL